MLRAINGGWWHAKWKKHSMMSSNCKNLLHSLVSHMSCSKLRCKHVATDSTAVATTPLNLPPARLRLCMTDKLKGSSDVKGTQRLYTSASIGTTTTAVWIGQWLGTRNNTLYTRTARSRTCWERLPSWYLSGWLLWSDNFSCCKGLLWSVLWQVRLQSQGGFNEPYVLGPDTYSLSLHGWIGGAGTTMTSLTRESWVEDHLCP